jgi:hypothetical protein
VGINKIMRRNTINNTTKIMGTMGMSQSSDTIMLKGTIMDTITTIAQMTAEMTTTTWTTKEAMGEIKDIETLATDFI